MAPSGDKSHFLQHQVSQGAALQLTKEFSEMRNVRTYHSARNVTSASYRRSLDELSLYAVPVIWHTN
jgi:hypothetical protein